METQGPLQFDFHWDTQDGSKEKKVETQDPLPVNPLPFDFHWDTQDDTKEKKAETQGPLLVIPLPFDFHWDTQDDTKEKKVETQGPLPVNPLPFDFHWDTQDGTKEKKAETQSPLQVNPLPFDFHWDTQDDTKEKKSETQGPLPVNPLPFDFHWHTHDDTKEKKVGTQGLLPVSPLPFDFHWDTQDGTKEKKAETQGPLPVNPLPFDFHWHTQDNTKEKKAVTQGPLPVNQLPFDFHWHTQDGTKEKKAVRGGRIFKNIIPFMPTKYRMELAATDAQLRSNRLLKSYIFLNEFLQPGRNFTLLFSEKQKDPILLPREVAKSLPFSTTELPKILALFSIDPTSNDANNIKKILHHCEMPTRTTREVKHCASSLESMIDFVVSTLRTRNINAATSMPPSKEGAIEGQYTITSVKEINGPNHVSCHLETYVHALFYCHMLDETKAYKVALVDKDGTKSEMVALCHANTSQWDPNHIVLQLLKVAPGTVPVCHFLPEGHITWSPNKQIVSS